MRSLALVLAAALATTLVTTTAQAQTDFYNTDRGRPLAVEDATVIERRAIELQLIPLRIDRVAPGINAWGIAPELAFGILPRTQLEFSIPLRMIDRAALGGQTAGAAGVEVEVLHQLNTETQRYPAFALGAGVHLPAGPFAPARTLASVRALATRTLSIGRVHLNASYTPGAALTPADNGADDPRWSAGEAFDHTFPLQQLLVGVDLTAQEALLDDGIVAGG